MAESAEVFDRVVALASHLNGQNPIDEWLAQQKDVKNPLEFLTAMVDALRNSRTEIEVKLTPGPVEELIDRTRMAIGSALLDLRKASAQVLAKKAELLGDQSDAEARRQLVQEVKAELEAFIANHPIYVGGETPHRLAFSEIFALPADASVEIKDTVIDEADESDVSTDFSELGRILSSLQYSEFLDDFERYLGHVDLYEVHRDTMRFGAKGANLLALKKILDGLGIMTETEITIPEFNLIPVDIYEKWKSSRDVTEDLKPFYEWMRARSVAVRSSAVHSEDGEELTGAGIYATAFLTAESSFDNFANAVYEVYRSVNSQGAISYRARNGVESESMAIVLQEFVPVNFSGGDAKGYVNTALPGPGGALIQVDFEDGDARPLLVKSALVQSMAQEIPYDDDAQSFHFQPDRKRIKNRKLRQANIIARIAYLIEKTYGKFLQIEFIVKPIVGYDTPGVFLLQARVLPPKFSEASHIDFPKDEEPLFEGRALGAGDMELNVLDPKADNTKRHGVVFFRRNYLKSREGIEKHLPKSGAVVILEPSREFGGHIETLCAERGIMCIFPEELGDKFDEMAQLEHSNESRALLALSMDEVSGEKAARLRENLELKTFHGHSRLRVVCNGIEGKIYAPQKEQGSQVE